jgi:hypothetical protein
VPTWSVNSYSYPNPFQGSASGQTAAWAQGAWEMFESFAQRPSYASVKTYWENHPSRPVKPHAVESWKATFEEFGLLYVLSKSDNVVVTGGGHQLVAAASADDEREFAWIALNLILRYPVRGESGRRSLGDDFDKSDLLLYWYLHAALIELDGFWQAELFRVLAQVFRRSEAQGAIELVREMRSGTIDITTYLDPSGGGSGGVYNTLNQVLNHGSLNHMLFTSSRKESRYFGGTSENWWHINDDFRDLIELALGGQVRPLPAGCATQASLMQRMPSALNPPDEQAYFDYVGAQVTPLAEAQATAAAAAAPTVEYGGEGVFLLSEGRHFTRVDALHIVGPVHVLCVLAGERRVIVSDHLERTFMVEHKELAGNEVVVRLRPARPILDHDYVAALFGGGAGV